MEEIVLQRVRTARVTERGGETMPFTEFMIRPDNRDKTLRRLQASFLPSVQALLECRVLTNTVVFPPSSSGAGQAFDAAVCICGMLELEGRLTTSLRDSVTALATRAGQGGNPQPLEEVLIDFISLGERLDWDRLAAVVEHVDSPATLRRLTGAVRNAGQHLPVLVAAVKLSGKPEAVCDYLENFGQSGLTDLDAAMPYGAGGVDELLRSNQRLYVSSVRRHLATRQPWAPVLAGFSDFVLRAPRLAFACKCSLYLAGGFLLAMAFHCAMNVPAWETPLRVRGYDLAREVLFALGFLFVVLLLSEPFLAQDNQKMDPTFRLRLPTLGSVVPARTPSANPSTLMNSINLLTLLLFFLLQALLYLASLVKLQELRQADAPARIRLRLLENEEHLFDAGLYLGFVGTIISLILVSLGIIKPSLMAAYSSTSFGIIFVSIFKIFNLRPARRKLLLEAESQSEAAAVETAPPVSTTAYAAP